MFELKNKMIIVKLKYSADSLIVFYLYINKFLCTIIFQETEKLVIWQFLLSLQFISYRIVFIDFIVYKSLIILE
jgi:hypothetical protein